jgi:hypothetical protein
MTARPVFDADGITGAALLQSIDRFGCALIRNCIDPAAIAAMEQQATDAYAKTESRYRSGELDEEERDLFEMGHIHPWALNGGVDPLIVIKFLVQSGASRVLRTLWRGTLNFLGAHCLPRRQSPGHGVNWATPFHQDASFLGNSCLILNFWIPLVACGRDAPGLELVLDHPPGIVERAAPFDVSKPDYSGIELPSQEILDRYGADKMWHPEMQLGDILVFSNLAIHRTYLREDMQNSRISLEVRCTDGSNANPQVAEGPLIAVRFDA